MLFVVSKKTSKFFLSFLNISIVDLNELSTRNIQDNPTIINNNQLLSEDDSLLNNDVLDIPIHLVGGKK